MLWRTKFHFIGLNWERKLNENVKFHICCPNKRFDQIFFFWYLWKESLISFQPLITARFFFCHAAVGGVEPWIDFGASWWRPAAHQSRGKQWHATLPVLQPGGASAAACPHQLIFFYCAGLSILFQGSELVFPDLSLKLLKPNKQNKDLCSGGGTRYFNDLR